MWLYSISLLVELAAFLWLRRAEPAMLRPWRVPGGAAGAVTVAVLPALFALAAMATAGWMNTAAGVTAALTGPVAYLLFRRARSSPVLVTRTAAESPPPRYSEGREES
jgi:hypothetical protein